MNEYVQEFNELIQSYEPGFYQTLTDEYFRKWNGDFKKLANQITLFLHPEESIKLLTDIKNNLSDKFNKQLKKGMQDLKTGSEKFSNNDSFSDWCFDGPCNC